MNTRSNYIYIPRNEGSFLQTEPDSKRQRLTTRTVSTTTRDEGTAREARKKSFDRTILYDDVDPYMLRGIVARSAARLSNCHLRTASRRQIIPSRRTFNQRGKKGRGSNGRGNEGAAPKTKARGKGGSVATVEKR